jgi:DNA-binding HxlR family transcriptional regulator
MSKPTRCINHYYIKNDFVTFARPPRVAHSTHFASSYRRTEDTADFRSAHVGMDFRLCNCTKIVFQHFNIGNRLGCEIDYGRSVQLRVSQADRIYRQINQVIDETLNRMPSRKIHTTDDPLARALDLLGGRWGILVLWTCLKGARKFEDFTAALSISTNLLSHRLKLLLAANLINKSRYQERPPRHEYLPSEAAIALSPTLWAIVHWSSRQFPEVDIDPRTGEDKYEPSDHEYTRDHVHADPTMPGRSTTDVELASRENT